MPGWVETLQYLECSGIPFLRIWTWNFGVADIHRHVVCPERRLTWDHRSLDRDVRTQSLGCSISPKVSYRFVKYGLQISTQLLIALRRRRRRECEKKQEKYQDNYLEHGTLERARSNQAMSRQRRDCPNNRSVPPCSEPCQPIFRLRLAYAFKCKKHSHVARENGQHLSQAFPLAHPSLQDMYREGVPQVMHSWRGAVGVLLTNPRGSEAAYDAGFQRFVFGISDQLAVEHFLSLREPGGWRIGRHSPTGATRIPQPCSELNTA